MDEKMQKVVSLSKTIESLVAELKLANEQMEGLLKEAGLGTMAQDPDTGAVYKVVRPEGRFVVFPEIGYVRTRIKALGEKQGGLSLTDAREAGYEVE